MMLYDDITLFIIYSKKIEQQFYETKNFRNIEK